MAFERDGRIRAVIGAVTPEVDGGRFPIKRVVGEQVAVEADIYADGHDLLSAVLLHRAPKEAAWTETPMAPLGNDRLQGTFQVAEVGQYRYTIMAWVDTFRTWRRDLLKRLEAHQDVSTDLLIGAQLIEEAASRAQPNDQAALLRAGTALRSLLAPQRARIMKVMTEAVVQLALAYSDRGNATCYKRELMATVERERARFSTWYEMFPRSTAHRAGVHGTFKDCESCLPYIAELGFDVLYLPPIHPIGRAYRKGKNNATTPAHDDVGSPWAIGSEEGGHMAVHSALGTVEDFRHMVSTAKEHGIEVALDIAFQCSPDHPYVKEHPEWFRHRPDGTIQYAENPPKKYQDIYPFDFESEDWQALWEELKRVVLYWADEGVQIFRMDNPHTKPFSFWEWLIREVKAQYPDALFLAEAFTRPKVMYNLAKLGFTQSYTYFSWRNTKSDLIQYVTELTQTSVKEFFRPNLWPNTPDILTEYLQTGGRPAFIARLVLAATLGASYGIYGPAFELYESQPREPGSEEYLDSEKYQVRHWDIHRKDSLKPIIARVNRIRRENPALQSDDGLRFHTTDNESLVCFSKATEDHSNVILVMVNLDPHHTHAGWTDLSLDALGIGPSENFQAHDLVTTARYLWRGPRNYVTLDPQSFPAHIFLVRRRTHTEQDFEYYL